MAGYEEPANRARDLPLKYFVQAAPRYSLRTRTGPNCCGPNCPSGRRKGRLLTFKAKLEKPKPPPAKVMRYRMVGMRMIRVGPVV